MPISRATSPTTSETRFIQKVLKHGKNAHFCPPTETKCTIVYQKKRPYFLQLDKSITIPISGAIHTTTYTYPLEKTTQRGTYKVVMNVQGAPVGPFYCKIDKDCPIDAYVCAPPDPQKKQKRPSVSFATGQLKLQCDEYIEICKEFQIAHLQAQGLNQKIAGCLARAEKLSRKALLPPLEQKPHENKPQTFNKQPLKPSTKPIGTR